MKGCRSTLAAALIAALLTAKLVFPAFCDALGMRVAAVLGITRGMTPAVEALGYGLTDVGLHNSIISVIDFFADGEVYPVGRMERSGDR